MNELICIYAGCLFLGLLFGTISVLSVRLYLLLDIVILLFALFGLCSNPDLNLTHIHASNFNWIGFILVNLVGRFWGRWYAKKLREEYLIRKMFKNMIKKLK